MNAEMLKSAGIDYDRGVKRFLGRAHLYEKALARFPHDGTFARIRTAYEGGEAGALMASAHEFKGMCGNIGLFSLYEAADAIVQMLRGGTFAPEELNKAYALLEGKYNEAYKAITAAMEDTE